MPHDGHPIPLFGDVTLYADDPLRLAMTRPAFSRRGLLTLAAAASLSACASTPDIDDYLLPSDASPLQRYYASQAVLSGGPFVSGNRTRLLADGARAFPAMFAAMDQARDHINRIPAGRAACFDFGEGYKRSGLEIGGVKCPLTR